MFYQAAHKMSPVTSPHSLTSHILLCKCSLCFIPRPSHSFRNTVQWHEFCEERSSSNFTCVVQLLLRLSLWKQHEKQALQLLCEACLGFWQPWHKACSRKIRARLVEDFITECPEDVTEINASYNPLEKHRG